MRFRSLINLLSAALALLAFPSAGAAQDETTTAPATAPLPPNSLYQLEGTWTRESGAEVRLAEFAGHPVAIVMFFGSCRRACPTLFADMKRLEAAVAPQALDGVRFLMVSIDPARDTVEALANMAANYQLDLSRWALLVADDSHTRELAALLGVRYRDQADGQFSHSNVITILNPDGEIVLQVEGLNQPLEAARTALESFAP
jgi:protein SCO1/2